MSDPIVTIGYVLLALPVVAVIVFVACSIAKNDPRKPLAAFDWVEQNATRHEYFIFREAIRRRPFTLTAHDRAVFEALANRAPQEHAHHIRDIAKVCDNRLLEIGHE